MIAVPLARPGIYLGIWRYGVYPGLWGAPRRDYVLLQVYRNFCPFLTPQRYSHAALGLKGTMDDGLGWDKDRKTRYSSYRPFRSYMGCYILMRINHHSTRKRRTVRREYVLLRQVCTWETRAQNHCQANWWQGYHLIWPEVRKSLSRGRGGVYLMRKVRVCLLFARQCENCAEESEKDQLAARSLASG